MNNVQIKGWNSMVEKKKLAIIRYLKKRNVVKGLLSPHLLLQTGASNGVELLTVFIGPLHASTN